MTISRREVRRAGLSIAELGARTGISYMRIYRATINPSNLTLEEVDRVRRALVEAQIAAELSFA